MAISGRSRTQRKLNPREKFPIYGIVIIVYSQLGLSLLEWRFYYFHMFRNPVNQFMQLNPFPAVKTEWIPGQVQNVTRDGADIDDLAVR